MISQLTSCITIGKKVHCIRKCGDKKSRLKQKLWNVRTSVNWRDSRRAGRFLAIMDNLLLSEVQIIEKNRKQTKTTVGLYWEVYFRKTKGIIKILVKKKNNKKIKKRKEKYWTYNPGQNCLRKFSPSCPLSYATKLFPKRRLCGKKTPSPNSMLLPTNVQGSGFLLNTQQHCFQGKGKREEPVQLRCLEKWCPSIQFSQQFCPRL